MGLSLQPSCGDTGADQRYFRTSAAQQPVFIFHALTRHLLPPLAHHPLLLESIATRLPRNQSTPHSPAIPSRHTIHCTSASPHTQASLVSDTRAQHSPTKQLVWFQHPTQRRSCLHTARARLHTSHLTGHILPAPSSQTPHQALLYPTLQPPRGCYHSQNFSPRGPHIPPRRPTSR